MMSIIKHFSNLRIQKLLGSSAKLNLNYLSTGPASEAEIKETADFYKSLATKYNAAADLISLGLHRIWRKELVNNIEICQGTRILDAPAGTGLNTLKVLEKSKQLISEPDFLVTMFDINPHMMKVGRDNFKKLGYAEKNVNYVEGNLHKLPFDADSFDIVITSLANRPYIDFRMVLKEVNRVLKSQGKVILLDYCHSQYPTIIQRLRFNYVQFIANKIEKIILGDLGTADFVIKSIRDVVAKTDLEEMLKDADFEKSAFKPLSLGTAGLTVAYKK